jgi:hypothetical protein
LYQTIEYLKSPKKEFFVRSEEQSLCQCCDGHLKVVGSRERTCINGLGEKRVLIIRRLGCKQCRKIHHELPDILVPYKRHVRESIEAIVNQDPAASVSADQSTLGRWKRWFDDMSDYFQGCLKSIAIQSGQENVEDKSGLPKSKLQRIWQYVGNAPGWLARIVRPIVNTNLWVHTRYAFCS